MATRRTLTGNAEDRKQQLAMKEIKTMAKTKLEEKRLELKATVAYGEEIATKAAETSDDSALADFREEMSETETKAEALRNEIKGMEKDDARTTRIRSIGQDIFGQTPVETEDEDAPRYRDPVEAFVKSDTFKAFVADVKSGKRNAQSEGVEWKTPAEVTVDQAGDKNTSQYVAGFARQDADVPLDVGSLFSQGTMSGSNLSYLSTSGAAAGGDFQDTLGSQKGGSFDLAVDVANVTARTVAAVALIPSQNLDDLQGLEAEIRAVLLSGPEGLGRVLENAYINGDASTDIDGILDTAPTNVDLTSTVYNSKAIFKAMADIKSGSGFTADAVVVHPDDWYLLSTEVGSEDNRPLFGPWGAGWGQNGIGPRLVVSNAATSGQAIVGAFKASQRFVRSGVTVSADASGLGLRDKNLVLFVAETRELLLHRYARANFRTVTMNTVA